MSSPSVFPSSLPSSEAWSSPAPQISSQLWTSPYTNKSAPSDSDQFVLHDGFISSEDMALDLSARYWRVVEFSSLEQLAGLRAVWNRLAGNTPGATHFMTYDWFECYWKHNAADQKLRVLVVATEEVNSSEVSNHQTALSDSAVVVGIVPLVVRSEPTRLGSVRVLTFPLAGWGSLYSPIGNCPDMTLSHALRYLSTQPRDYDLFDLRWIDSRTGYGDLIVSTMRAQKLSPRCSVWHETAQVDLQYGWEPYWASRSSHWRTNVRSNFKKLTQQGDVEYVRYRPDAQSSTQNNPRWDLYDHCERLAGKSWQGHRTDGTTLSHPQVNDYLRAAHETAINCGAADINLLLVNQQPVAFAYNYAQFGSVYGLRAGYDPAWKQFGPGSVLMYHMLANSAERGDRVFDLGPGNLKSKEPWLTSVVAANQYTIYSPRSLKAWALKLKHAIL